MPGSAHRRPPARSPPRGWARRRRRGARRATARSAPCSARPGTRPCRPCWGALRSPPRASCRRVAVRRSTRTPGPTWRPNSDRTSPAYASTRGPRPTTPPGPSGRRRTRSGPTSSLSAGRYAPGTGEGRRLLAHELTHVRQQQQGPVSGTDRGDGVQVSDPSDPFEQEASRTAEDIAAPADLPAPGRSAGPRPRPRRRPAATGRRRPAGRPDRSDRHGHRRAGRHRRREDGRGHGDGRRQGQADLDADRRAGWGDDRARGCARREDHRHRRVDRRRRHGLHRHGRLDDHAGGQEDLRADHARGHQVGDAGSGPGLPGDRAAGLRDGSGELRRAQSRRGSGQHRQRHGDHRSRRPAGDHHAGSRPETMRSPARSSRPGR